MQGVDADKKYHSSGDEELINFRPSPNFKHMKKYLKSKFEEANQMANQMAANPSASNEVTNSTSDNHDIRERVNNTAQEVQPPLPPNPPPPESPPIINLKKEIEDDEYQSTSTEKPSEFSSTEEIMTEMIKTDQSEATEKPEVTMCRNFARGTCKKGTSCIFAHKLILSQLPGVYTFCRNFQNAVCTFPKCKFVHATVFEKENFFRTGYLPPHALSHLKEGVLQPPPPPPPAEEIPTEVPQVFANAPPPPTIPSSFTPVPVINCAPLPSTVEKSFRSGLSPTTSPKREWSDSDEISNSPCDTDSCEPLAKKCKNCDSNEFRYQYNKAKVETIIRATEKMNKKISQLNTKSSKLFTILATLFKPLESSSGTNGLNTSLNIGADKDKAMLDHLILTANRMPAIGEDNNKNNNVNFSNLLAKIIMNNGDPVGPPDGI